MFPGSLNLDDVGIIGLASLTFFGCSINQLYNWATSNVLGDQGLLESNLSNNLQEKLFDNTDAV